MIFWIWTRVLLHFDLWSTKATIRHCRSAIKTAPPANYLNQRELHVMFCEEIKVSHFFTTTFLATVYFSPFTTNR